MSASEKAIVPHPRSVNKRAAPKTNFLSTTSILTRLLNIAKYIGLASLLAVPITAQSDPYPPQVTDALDPILHQTHTLLGYFYNPHSQDRGAIKGIAGNEKGEYAIV